MQTVTAIFQYLLSGILTAVTQVLILLGPGLFLAFIMYFITRWLRDRGGLLFDWKIWVYGTFLGTVLHELGHAIFAVLFGHRIVAIKLFDPDPYTGTLGYVSHSFNPKNLYHRIGNFFIGIGPIIIGPLAIYGLSLLLLGQEVFAPLQNVRISTFGSIPWIPCRRLGSKFWLAGWQCCGHLSRRNT